LERRHQQALLQYLAGESKLSSADWLDLMEAIDVLAKSRVLLDDQALTFAQFYSEWVDRRYADEFLRTIVRIEDLEQAALTQQASVARQLVQGLNQTAGFDRRDMACQFLLVYCLFWWHAFARGYLFEVRIFRDLTASGIEFAGHDITDRTARQSPYDLVVSGMRGDIKSSTYFLSAETLGRLQSDFFITRAYHSTTREWVTIAVLRPEMWRRIDGETQAGTVQELSALLPTPVRIQIGAHQLVVILHEEWKRRIRDLQAREGSDEYG
jgi:hypothetical protein